MCVAQWYSMCLASEPFWVQKEERERNKERGRKEKGGRERGREFSGVLLISSVPIHNHNLLILKARILKVFTIKN